MPLTSPVINRASSYSNYDLLRVYTYYRTLLGSLLLLMFQGDIAPNILGNDHPDIFLYTSIAYTAINIITLGLLWRVKFLPSDQQSFVLLVIDMAAIGLMMFASGGALSGLGYLQLVVVAAGGMLLPAQLAILLAALASITVIGESVVRLWLLSIDNRTLFSAGTLGALLFITALTFQYLARKIRTSSQEALAQAKQAEHLQRLAQLIVERMRTGIVVLNREHDIELLNRSAADLLGIRPPETLPLCLADVPILKSQSLASRYPNVVSHHNGGCHQQRSQNQFRRPEPRQQRRNPGICRRQPPDHPASPTTQARLFGPPDRQYRPRGSQPAWRDQPRQPAAR